MKRRLAVAIAVLTGLAISVASACGSRSPTLVEVTVQISGLAVRTDYSASDLHSMAAEARQQPAHPVLGAYAETVGYQTSSRHVQSSGCEAVKVDIRIIVKERVIEIARDLRGIGCLFDAAVRHYSRHAQVQAEALKRSIASMQRAYQAKFADRRATDGPASSKTPAEQDAGRFVRDWLNAFHDTLLAVNASADTDDEVQALENACRA